MLWQAPLILLPERHIQLSPGSRTIHSLVVQYKLEAQASGSSDWVRGQFTRLRFELVFAHGFATLVAQNSVKLCAPRASVFPLSALPSSLTPDGFG